MEHLGSIAQTNVLEKKVKNTRSVGVPKFQCVQKKKKYIYIIQPQVLRVCKATHFKETNRVLRCGNITLSEALFLLGHQQWFHGTLSPQRIINSPRK